MFFRILSATLLIFTLLSACSGEKQRVRSGRLVYAIDYPEAKGKFLLYGILPKEMKLDFRDGRMKCTIEKANFVNELYIDCKAKKLSTNFEFGTDVFFVKLDAADIRKMIAEQQAYTIAYTSETDTIAGFNVKKAVATAKSDPQDVVELWYTDEIAVNNPNWYNPFREVPGVLLQYSIKKYGMRMDFRATRFEDVKPDKSDLIHRSRGNQKTYSDYNSEITELFKAFE